MNKKINEWINKWMSEQKIEFQYFYKCWVEIQIINK